MRTQPGSLSLLTMKPCLLSLLSTTMYPHTREPDLHKHVTRNLYEPDIHKNLFGNKQHGTHRCL